MQNHRVATCACGNLKAECAGEPDRIAACNCTECQRRTGSVFGVGAYYQKSQVTLMGEYKRYTRSSDAGRWLNIFFCPTCGTSVAWESQVYPDIMGVAVGCFADKHFGKPIRVVFTEHKHDWVQFPADVQQFEKLPF